MKEIKELVAIGSVEAICGGTACFIGGPQVGIETVVGLGGFLFAISRGADSSDQAEQLAREGKKVRAFVKVLQTNLEAAFGLAVTGAAIGHRFGPEGMVTGAILGVFTGVSGCGNFTFMRVARILVS